MKKSTLLKLLLSAAISVAFYSCKDDKNENIIDSENVIKSNEDALALVNGAYGPLQTLSSSFSFIIESATEGTISFEGEENEAGPEVSRFETKPTTWYAIKVYSRLYQVKGTDRKSDG